MEKVSGDETVRIQPAHAIAENTHEEMSGAGFIRASLRGIYARIDSTAFRALLNLAALSLLALTARAALIRPLVFDDAYMFNRYAVHVWHGLGMCWNLDGVHTAGMTSLGWFLLVLPVSLLPLWSGKVLALTSVIVGIASFATAAAFVTRLSRLRLFRNFWFVFPVAVILATRSSAFRYNMKSGMDTMLSFAADVVLCGLIWAWVEQPTRRRNWAAWIGLAGVAACIVRPENGLLALIAPLLAALLLVEKKHLFGYFNVLLTFGVSLAAYLILYRLYFHTFLPLSFYMKSQHPYRGYAGTWIWNPELYLRGFLLLAIPVVIIPVATWSNRSVRIAATFLVPVVLTFFYLSTVTQIMGSEGRYYIPFLAPVLVAAFWMTDNAMLQAGSWRTNRGLLALGTFCVIMILIWTALGHAALRRLREARSIQLYPSPTLVMQAREPLPELPWFETIETVARQVIAPLPPGASIAASEVGLIGAAAPHVGVIDLSGLNDNDIALHGFRMDALLDRKPVLIWFPHTHYTWQRQQMFCSPRLLEEYLLLGGNAFNYSIAVRKDSAGFASVWQHVTDAFDQLYPGRNINSYLVTGIERNGVCAGP